MTELCEQALKLHDLGWCILPVPHHSKHPSIDWKQYQSQRPDRDQHMRWFHGDFGMCAICGPVSGNLVALDFDADGAYLHWANANPELADTLPTAISARGRHVFFRTPQPIPSTALFLKDLEGKAGDVLSNGKLVVLPPTLHPSGFVREWFRPPTSALPILTLEQAGALPPVQVDPKFLSGALIKDAIAEGERHEHLKRLAARLRKQAHGHAMISEMLACVNESRCKPPLPVHEVRAIADWAARLPAGDHPPREYENDDDLRERYIETETNIITNTIPRGDDPEGRFASLFTSGESYMEEVGEEQQTWIVEDLLPETYLVVLGGTSKAGKSCLLTALGVSVARGEPFMGLPTHQGAVLWVAYEESRQERALALRAHGGAPENFYITHQKVHIDSSDGLAALRWWIRKTGAKLLVIDPLYGANTAESLSDGRKARETLAGLKDLCGAERCSAVVLHHITKNVSAGLTRERFADSNQILATASMDILMDVVDETEGKRTIRLQGRGRGAFANKTWLVQSLGLTNYDLTASGSDEDIESLARDESLLAPLREAEGPMTAEQIAEILGQKLGTIRNRLTQLVKQGQLVTVGKADRATLYTLAQPELQTA